MRQDDFPHPVSDPETEGVPEYADPDSTAWDDVESPRVADGPEPAPVPPVTEPVGVDRYGTTAEEARRGEPAEYKLAREDVHEPVGRDYQPDYDPEVLDRLVLDDTPIDPHLESAVSMYDRPDPLLDQGAPIGRLVEPDEGVHEDDEPDAVAYDAGAAGGGPSAEEAAIHEVRDL
jgi:hypothetical protein